jgi:hypothetical protein
MNLATAIASMAVVLGVVLTAGYANGEGPAPAAGATGTTAQDRLDAREAARRAAVAEQQRRKDAFERACNKPIQSESEFEVCRTAYRRLESGKL